jgi:TatD DNase family protein
VYAAVALHPTRADALTEAARSELEQLAAQPRVVAIGETGMDLYWPGKLDGCAAPDTQREAFAWHIDLAKRTGKPLMIHNREADTAVLDVLRAEGAPDTVIFHCFSSGPEMAGSCSWRPTRLSSPRTRFGGRPMSPTVCPIRYERWPT